MKLLDFHIKLLLYSRNELHVFFVLIILILASFSCNYIGNDSELAISDPEKVTFIGIYGRDTVEIESIKNNWKLNSEQEPDPVAIENFLYAFKNLETVGATTGKGLDSLVSRKILIRRGNKKSLYRFYASDDLYLLHHEGSARVFKIRVKSAPEADLNTIFSDQPSAWANRLILSVKPGNIKKLIVEPADSLGAGFIMKRDSNYFRIFSSKGEEMDAASLNNERTFLYSSYFDGVYYDSQITEDSIISRINKEKPFYIFKIETMDGNQQEVKVYPIYHDGGGVNIFEGAITLSGQNRVLKINYVYLDPLFQDLSYFSVE